MCLERPGSYKTLKVISVIFLIAPAVKHLIASFTDVYLVYGFVVLQYAVVFFGCHILGFKYHVFQIVSLLDH